MTGAQGGGLAVAGDGAGPIKARGRFWQSCTHTSRTQLRAQVSLIDLQFPLVRCKMPPQPLNPPSESCYLARALGPGGEGTGGGKQAMTSAASPSRVCSFPSFQPPPALHSQAGVRAVERKLSNKRTLKYFCFYLIPSDIWVLSF